MRLEIASREAPPRLVRVYHDDGRVEVHPTDDIFVQELLQGVYVGDDCLRAPIPLDPLPDDPDMWLNEPRRRQTSAKGEADVNTQAPRVKPTEGDIHEAEYDLHEQPPEPAPLSIDDLISSGTMLTTDERALRVGTLAGQIEEYAQERIAARYDANARADIERALQDHAHKGFLGLEISAEEEAAFTRANEQHAWILAQETHARQLRRQLPSLPLELLRVYDLERANWP